MGIVKQGAQAARLSNVSRSGGPGPDARHYFPRIETIITSQLENAVTRKSLIWGRETGNEGARS